MSFDFPNRLCYRWTRQRGPRRCSVRGWVGILRIKMGVRADIGRRCREDAPETNRGAHRADDGFERERILELERMGADAFQVERQCRMPSGG